MLLAITTVSRHSKADERDRVFLQALEAASQQGVDLLTLPAGYFHLPSIGRLCQKAKEICLQATRQKIAVAVGIDVGPKRRSTKGGGKAGRRITKTRIEKQTLPSFVVCCTPSSVACWRQRSTNSKDQAWVPDEACSRQQELFVSGHRVEILSCGEVFSKRIREQIVNRVPNVEAVVDLAHKGAKWRVDPALSYFANHGMSAFGTSHVNRKKAMKRGFMKRVRVSSRQSDLTVEGPPRIEMKLWKI